MHYRPHDSFLECVMCLTHLHMYTKTSYSTQLSIFTYWECFDVRRTSWVLTTSWLFTARWSTWPGNHLVPCVAELVGYCIPIHAYRGHRYPKCLFYLSGLSLCLSVDHFCLVPVDDMVLFHGMVCDGWLVSVSKKFSYTGLYQLIESIQHWFAHDFSL